MLSETASGNAAGTLKFMQSPRIVLVVESPLIALFYRCTLEGVGFTVHHFTDADSALADVREQRPACVAIDPIQPLLGAAEYDKLCQAGVISKGRKK